MHGLRYLTKPLQIDELRELVQVVATESIRRNRIAYIRKVFDC